MRARQPDRAGYAVNDGVRIHYEVHGDANAPTLFLLPTWAALDAQVWKLQVPYLARHFRVLVADPRGNGRSDRPADPAAYGDDTLVDDAVAVLDATGTGSAVCVGLSMGARVLLELAVAHPERIDGAMFIAPSIRVEEQYPTCWPDDFDAPFSGSSVWDRYNGEFWREDLPGFARWFFGEVFSEPHSTKQVDDTVEWTLQTDADTLIAIEHAPATGRTAPELARQVTCPSLVVTGGDDRIVQADLSRTLAELLGCPLEVAAGGGHCVQARHPVWFNLLLRRFVDHVGAAGQAS